LLKARIAMPCNLVSPAQAALIGLPKVGVPAFPRIKLPVDFRRTVPVSNDFGLLSLVESRFGQCSNGTVSKIHNRRWRAEALLERSSSMHASAVRTWPAIHAVLHGMPT
jgi:hypothetical protein